MTLEVIGLLSGVSFACEVEEYLPYNSIWVFYHLKGVLCSVLPSDNHVLLKQQF